MKKILSYLSLAIVSIFILTFGAWSSDWSNPNPRVLSDLAGPLLLKHDSNWIALFNSGTGYLNLLKDSFSGSSAPANPSAGQVWYDTSVSPALYRVYTGSGWTGDFGGDVVSTGTSTFSGVVSFSTSSTNLISTISATWDSRPHAATKTITGGYTILATDMGQILVASGLTSAATWTLPNPTAVPKGSEIVTKNTSTTWLLTISGMIDGASTTNSIAQHGAMAFTSDGASTWMVIAPSMPQRGFSAYLSSAQTLTAINTWYKVQLNTKDFDYNSWYDNTTNYRFQPTVANIYQISVVAEINLWQGATAGSAVAVVAIYKNGSSYKRAILSTYIPAGNGNTNTPSLSIPVYLNGSTDYVEMWVEYIATTGYPPATITNSVFSAF